MLILLTYETNHNSTSKNGSLRYLVKSATDKGWKMMAIGDGNKWIGFGQKTIALMKILKNLIKEYGKDVVVVVTDARDVICNRSPRSFLRNFDKVRQNRRIVFGSEIGCCVPPMYLHEPGSFITKTGRKKKATYDDEDYAQYKWSKKYGNIDNKWLNLMEKDKRKLSHIKENWFRALNAGLYTGYATSILKIMKMFQPLGMNEDDQALWSNVMYSFPRTLIIDYNNELFSNANTWDGKPGCFFKYDKETKTWENVKTKTKPYFIQTPGASQNNFACYRKLTSKIKL